MKRNICKAMMMSLIVTLLLMLSGCGEAENNVKEEDSKVLVERVITQYKETNKSLADNAVDIFREYYSEQNKNENMIMSPSSLQSAMGLLLDAADDNSATLSELENFYGIGKADTEVLLSNLMSTQYNSNIENAETITRDEDSTGNTYIVTNSIWANTGGENREFCKVYSENVWNKYGAASYGENLDTMEGTEKVNSWVKENTLGLIEKLSDEPLGGDVHLINAVGFDCKWETPFEETATGKEDFKTPSGKVKVDMMHLYEGVSYIDKDYAKGVRLDYAPIIDKESDEIKNRSRFSYIALKPTGDIQTVIDALNAGEISYFIDNDDANGAEVHLSLPKYKFDCKTDLVDIAKNMGVKTAFDADSGIYLWENKPDVQSYISGISQLAMIDVSESGTKAAAVTDIEMIESEDVEEPKKVIEIKFDEPFVYIITDNINKTPIFMGVVNEPK
ncbi:MAG: hypothetical protein IJ736_02030 [Firmicutes bacterium]|nr:hypothetical protein [Bacillota bacterium]